MKEYAMSDVRQSIMLYRSTSTFVFEKGGYF